MEMDSFHLSNEDRTSGEYSNPPSSNMSNDRQPLSDDFPAFIGRAAIGAQANELVLRVLQTNEFLGSLKNQLEELAKNHMRQEDVLQLAKQIGDQLAKNKELGVYDQCFEILHSGFPEKVRSLFSELTTTEAKVCALIRIGLSSKEMGIQLHISSRTIDVHRLHIRRKFNLTPYQSLEKFIAEL
jgi:DNA-binding NarL/FixJ family response regulator